MLEANGFWEIGLNKIMLFVRRIGGLLNKNYNIEGFLLSKDS